MGVKVLGVGGFGALRGFGFRGLGLTIRGLFFVAGGGGGGGGL